MSLFFWVIGGTMYLAVGGAVGGIVAYRTRAWGNYSSDERAVCCAASVPLWPAALVVLLCIAICYKTLWLSMVVGRLYGNRIHSEKIDKARGQMLEDDLKRVNGNFDLVVNYDYGPCGACFGAGCNKCNGVGVVRSKHGVAV